MAAGLRRACALLTVGLLLAGCDSTSRPAGSAPTAGSAPAEGAAFNAVDVMFLQMMIPHHRQGLEMVRLASPAQGRPVRAEVRMLAAAIESTQAAEVQAMAGRLSAWGQPASADPDAHATHGGMPSTEVAALVRTPDAQFERALLNMLIAHQDDAVQMARQESAGGRSAEVMDLAARIDRSRSAQIDLMLTFLR